MLKKVFCFLLLLCLALPAGVFADSSRVSLSDLSLLANKLSAASVSGKTPASASSFTAYVNGVGRLRFKYTQTRVSKLDGTVVLMKGWVESAHGIQRAAGMLSYESGAATLTIDFPHVSNTTGERTLYRIVSSNIDSDPTTRIERTKASHFRDAHCGNEEPLFHNAAVSTSALAGPQSQELSSNAALREIELSIHLDSAYISSFGSSSSYIQGILNAAEAIYEDDLGMTFTVKRILADNGLFFFDSEGDSVLINFANYIDAVKNFTSSADVFHVFTGVDLTGGGNSGVIGVAFIGVTNDPDPGVVCRPDRFNGDPYNFGIRPAAVGATERSNSSTAGSLMVTFAHEMGHNFSAEHSASGIMTAFLDLNNLPGSFSSSSKNTIGSYVNEHGSCLSEQEEGGDDGGGGDDSGGDGDNEGGGGGGGSSDDNPADSIDVDFEFSLSEEGLVSGTVSIEEDPGDDCVFRMYMTTRKNAGRGILVASTTATDRSTTFFAEADRKAKRRNKRGKRKRIWAYGAYECVSQVSGQSDPVIVNAHRIQGKRKAGAKRWIRRLANILLGD